MTSKHSVRQEIQISPQKKLVVTVSSRLPECYLPLVLKALDAGVQLAELRLS